MGSTSGTEAEKHTRLKLALPLQRVSRHASVAPPAAPAPSHLFALDDRLVVGPHRGGQRCRAVAHGCRRAGGHRAGGAEGEAMPRLSRLPLPLPSRKPRSCSPAVHWLSPQPACPPARPPLASLPHLPPPCRPPRRSPPAASPRCWCRRSRCRGRPAAAGRVRAAGARAGCRKCRWANRAGAGPEPGSPSPPHPQRSCLPAARAQPACRPSQPLPRQQQPAPPSPRAATHKQRVVVLDVAAQHLLDGGRAPPQLRGLCCTGGGGVGRGGEGGIVGGGMR